MSLWPLILGMAAVTYVPRLLPMVFVRGERLPRRLRLFLACIPCAALGVLIVPGGLYAVEGRMLLCGLSLAAAFITAWFSRNLLIPMAAAVLSLLGLSYVL